jgi:nitrogen-specific signal transduction histidine kinase
MGLGLSISKRIMLAHNGSLSLDTTCPNTRFIVRLPKRQAPPTASEEWTKAVKDESETARPNT